MTTHTQETIDISQADQVAKEAETTKTHRSGESVRVWDPLVRIFHWTLTASFAIAFLVEDELLGVHVWAGYLVLGLIAIRLVWGLIGTRHARFSDFVRGPRAVLAYLKELAQFRAPRHLGHNPAGGIMILLLLLSVGITGLSGLGVYGAEEFAGPLASFMQGLPQDWGHSLEEVHEFFAYFSLVLIVFHVIGVLVSSLSHGENLVRSMVTGRKSKEI